LLAVVLVVVFDLLQRSIHVIHLGLVHPVSRTTQLKEILALDHVDDESGKEWYAMDTAWIASWLAYAHGDKSVAPAPGPCRNNRLLAFDYVEGKWKGRFGLWMAKKEQEGDFRRVSKEVWEQFVAYYPGSGPAISMEYDPSKVDASGVYDTSTWVIHDPPPPPEDAAQKKKKKKINLKRLSVIGKKKGEGKKENQDGNSQSETDGKSVKKENTEDSKLPAVPAPPVVIVQSGEKDSDDDDDVGPANPTIRRSNNLGSIIRDDPGRDSDDDDDDEVAAPGVVRRGDNAPLAQQTKIETNISYPPRGSFSTQQNPSNKQPPNVPAGGQRKPVEQSDEVRALIS
jgi:hypothetical protein